MREKDGTKEIYYCVAHPSLRTLCPVVTCFTYSWLQKIE